MKTHSPSISPRYIGQWLAVLGAVALAAACVSPPDAPAAAPAPSKAEITALLKASFNERGVAKLDRLDQTAIQSECSAANASGKRISDAAADRIQKAVALTIKYPQDGVYLGDWREGEKIAQNGRGLQFSDAAGAANGANCYACHQLTPKEISYGNQGPSLAKYGVIRGVKDPASAESAAMVKYTWGRIWNTHAFSACSNMPRFGDAGILTETQVKHVMALLLDPKSPVNQ